VLYAADFHNARIDAFGPTFQSITLPGGAFTVPTLPAGFAPFNVQALGGSIYVAYAMKDPNSEDELPGAGLGEIVRFNLDGTNPTVIASGGTLNAPWGMAIAPASFGPFGNDLLVGNFGNGTINVFDPVTHTFLGQLTDANGQPIGVEGLWGISFGNGVNGGLTNVLYFAAGPNDEGAGAFGSIAVPEPMTVGMLAVAAVGMMVRMRRR
jgi:uncharacterized protein (TIGR03118 family)